MEPAALAALRRSYELAGLDATHVDPDPISQFERWLGDAVAAEITEPNAMVLATADASGRPRARTVLLKGIDDAGFTFFTNYRSTKGQHLAVNPQASLCFPWIDLERQVTVVGDVALASRDESARYFRARPHGSQLGAIASRQSEVIADREVLDERFADLEEQYPEGEEVPVPDFWGGYRLVPDVIEFWQGRSDRLHDRIQYTREHVGGDGVWRIVRLSP